MEYACLGRCQGRFRNRLHTLWVGLTSETYTWSASSVRLVARIWVHTWGIRADDGTTMTTAMDKALWASASVRKSELLYLSWRTDYPEVLLVSLATTSLLMQSWNGVTFGLSRSVDIGTLMLTHTAEQLYTRLSSCRCHTRATRSMFRYH